jgi:hypothetical protein
MNKRLLFVSGVPRSGTTLFAQILNSSNEVFIGIERYLKKVNELSYDLFSRERLLVIEQDDTTYRTYNYSDYSGIDVEGKLSEVQWNNLKVIGDKIPTLFYNCFEPLRRIADLGIAIQIVFMLRDPFDIASSYQVRYLDEDDSWNHDGRSSIETCNLAFRDVRTCMLFQHPNLRIKVVHYDDVVRALQNNSFEFIDKISSIFGLEPSKFSSVSLPVVNIPPPKIQLGSELRRSVAKDINWADYDELFRKRITL